MSLLLHRMVHGRNVRNESSGDYVSSVFEDRMLLVSVAVAVTIPVAGMVYFQKMESKIAAMV